jgi:hypothetical protein
MPRQFVIAEVRLVAASHVLHRFEAARLAISQARRVVLGAAARRLQPQALLFTSPKRSRTPYVEASPGVLPTGLGPVRPHGLPSTLPMTASSQQWIFIALATM